MPSTDRKRGVEEQRDGRDASDVEGVAVREDAHEELRGEVEEAGAWRRGWRVGGGGGGGHTHTDVCVSHKNKRA